MPVSRIWRMRRKSSSTSCAGSAAVGSSRIDDPAAFLPPGDGAHDGDGGALRRRRVRERLVRVEGESEAREQLRGDLRLAAPVDPAEGSPLEPDDESDVVGRSEFRNDPELLVDEAQALALGILRVSELELLAVDPDLRARIGGVHAGERLDERRLAAAVVAEQRVHAPGGDFEVDVPDRAHPGKVFDRPRTRSAICGCSPLLADIAPSLPLGFLHKHGPLARVPLDGGLHSSPSLMPRHYQRVR